MFRRNIVFCSSSAEGLWNLLAFREVRTVPTGLDYGFGCPAARSVGCYTEL